MKVTTDGCLFGAWVASHASSISHLSKCLDIGAGTGLLSLMLAQKCGASVDAVEIEENAFLQAKENFESSPWSERLRVYNTGISEFVATHKYDLIICNPPFYQNELASPSASVNLARHDHGLTLQQLVIDVNRLMSDRGHFFVLLPYLRIEEFEGLALQSGLHLQRKCVVKQTAAHNFFRGMLMFWRDQTKTIIEEITIKNDVKYSNEFNELLKEFYLNID